MDCTVGFKCTAIMLCVQDYLRKVDPATNVGLSGDSIHYYTVGEVSRTKGTFTFTPLASSCGFICNKIKKNDAIP